MPQAPKLARLTRRPQFLAAARGRVQARGAVMIQMIPGPGSDTIRVGFTATKKIGGAVVRNRCKRRLREAARRLLPLHGKPGHDYVFVARASLVTRSWDRLLDDVKSALTTLAAPTKEGGDGAQRTERAPTPSDTGA